MRTSLAWSLEGSKGEGKEGRGAVSEVRALASGRLSAPLRSRLGCCAHLLKVCSLQSGVTQPRP